MVFFALVLVSGFRVDMAYAECDQLIVFLEELGQVEIFATVVGLLVEIHCSDSNLRALEIGGDVDDEIIGTHVAKQANEAAFVEFDQLFGNSNRFEPFAFHPVLDEHVPRQTDEVFLDQCIAIADEVHAIWGKQVFYLQTVNSGCVCFLDVKVVLIVVARIDDSDTEGPGVSKYAVVDSIDVKVMNNREVSTRLDNRVNVLQAVGKLGDHDMIVDDCLPQRVFVIVIVERC